MKVPSVELTHVSVYSSYSRLFYWVTFDRETALKIVSAYDRYVQYESEKKRLISDFLRLLQQFGLSIDLSMAQLNIEDVLYNTYPDGKIFVTMPLVSKSGAEIRINIEAEGEQAKSLVEVLDRIKEVNYEIDQYPIKLAPVLRERIASVLTREVSNVRTVEAVYDYANDLYRVTIEIEVPYGKDQYIAETYGDVKRRYEELRVRFCKLVCKINNIFIPCEKAILDLSKTKPRIIVGAGLKLIVDPSTVEDENYRKELEEIINELKKLHEKINNISLTNVAERVRELYESEYREKIRTTIEKLITETLG